MDDLEQRLRRSSRIGDQSALKDFLIYARGVMDEDQVYFYMQQNEMGLRQPQFWAARLNLLKNKCEYKEFMKISKQCNRNHQLKKHHQFWMITQVQKQLQKHLQNILRNKCKSKRTAKQYEVLNLNKVQKETRKFGKLQVFVDEQYRLQYRLEDLIDFATTRLQEQCDLQRNCYLRQISHKPKSFLTKNKEKLQSMTSELFTQSKARSMMMQRKNGMSRRSSNILRNSNKNEFYNIQTPQFKKKSISKNKKTTTKTNNRSQIDSIEILKRIEKKSKLNHHQSSKKSYPKQSNFDIICNNSHTERQKVRCSQINQIESHLLDAFVRNQQKNSSFSFGYDLQDPRVGLQQEMNGHKNRNENKQSMYCSKDEAFLNNSQTTSTQNHLMSFNQSVELQKIIKQFQMEKYLSQNHSDTHSNQQNCFIDLKDPNVCNQQNSKYDQYTTTHLNLMNMGMSMQIHRKTTQNRHQNQDLDESCSQVFQELLCLLQKKQERGEKQGQKM